MRPRASICAIGLVAALWGAAAEEVPVPEAPAEAPAGRTVRLQGSASTGRNRYVTGATVVVRRADDPAQLFVTTSDGKGRFVLDGLAEGDYRMEVRREGLATVVKEGVGLRFPARAVIEVLMHPAAAESAVGAGRPPAGGASAGSPRRVLLSGSVVSRDAGPLPDVLLRSVHLDGLTDPVLMRSAEDGSFATEHLAAGRVRVEARLVGFLPVWATLELIADTTLSLSMVRQPAGYDPSPLELMPLEQPLPPARYGSSPGSPARTAK